MTGTYTVGYCGNSQYQWRAPSEPLTYDGAGFASAGSVRDVAASSMSSLAM